MISPKHQKLTREQFENLKEIWIERIVDNMDVKDLVNYVTQDLEETYQHMPENQVIEEMYSWYDEEFVDDLIDEVKQFSDS